MSESSALRSADVRAVFRLVGECRELGDDSILWRQHLIAGLGPLTGAGFCVAAEIGNATQSSPFDKRTVDCGVNNGFNRAAWLGALAEFQADAFFNPLINAYIDRGEFGVVRPRVDFVPDTDWYSSFCFDGVVRT